MTARGAGRGLRGRVGRLARTLPAPPTAAAPAADWARLTPAERESAQILSERILAVGIDGLTADELDLAACLRAKLDGARDGSRIA